MTRENHETSKTPTMPSDANGFKLVEGRARAPRRKQATHTIHDVAAIAGVSSITVSRYFNAPEKVSESVRERLRQIIVETGYVPNQMAGRLASAESRLVGAVMQNTASLTFAALVKGMSDGFDDAGLQLLLANTDYSDAKEERAIRSFIGWHPSALILTRDDHTPDAEALLMAARHPIVETWGVVENRPFHQVGFPHSDVGSMLTQHFLEQGAQRIRFALRQAPHDFRALQRAAGYIKTMAQAGLQPDIDHAQCDDEYEAGAHIIDRFAQEPLHQRPQAIIFASDTMSLGAVLRAPMHGIQFPADAGIAGFGDAPIASRLSPSLTTVRPKPYAIGLKAAQLIIALKAEKKHLQPPSVHIVACDLIVRESSRLKR